MPLEADVTGIQDLNPAWPLGTDPKSEGDDHIRTVKSATQQSWPNMAGPNLVLAQIKMLGADMLDQRVVNMGDPVDVEDAVNLRTMNALQDTLEARQSFGKIQSNGTIMQGSGDFTVIKAGTGWYQLIFDVADFSQIAVATIRSATGYGFISVWEFEGDKVEIRIQNKNQVDTDFSFDFIRVWRP